MNDDRVGVDDEQTFDRRRQRRKTLINEDVRISINMLEIGLRVVCIPSIFPPNAEEMPQIFILIDFRCVVPIGNGPNKMTEKVTWEPSLSWANLEVTRHPTKLSLCNGIPARERSKND